MLGVDFTLQNLFGWAIIVYINIDWHLQNIHCYGFPNSIFSMFVYLVEALGLLHATFEPYGRTPGSYRPLALP